MKKKQDKVKILVNLKIKNQYYKMTLASRAIAESVLPGQFIMLKIEDVFLRRPLSVHRVLGENLELFYEVVGKGTEALSQCKAGDYIDIIGPLGNGFEFRASSITDRTSILVAGGMGVAPLLFLAQELKKQNMKCEVLRRKDQRLTMNDQPEGSGEVSFSRSHEARTTVLIGARTKDLVFCEKEFKKIGFDVKIATDDSSAGFKGKVTDLLRDLLRVTSYELRVTIFACGPRLMLEEISRISEEYNIPAQISLEAHLACGIGACLGCVVNTKNGYQRVCKEGPVFSVDDLLWY